MTEQSSWTGKAGPAGAGPGTQHRPGVDVAHDFYRALQAKDIDAFGRLWTEDAVYRVPVTPDGVPGEFVGREAVVAGLGGFFSLFGEVRCTWEVQPMGDPCQVLSQWTLEVDLLSGGTYRNRGASVFRLEGERIAEFTEYVDTAAFLGVFDAKAATARRFFDLLHGEDLGAWAALWHEHATVTVPYPPEGCPCLIEGRDEIVAAYRELLAVYEKFDAEPTGVHHSVGSDAVCVEYRVRATLAGGAVHTGDSVAVLRFRDGLISAYHDYFDPRRFQDVTGALPGGRSR
ncbi:nuclear transport factor 2 family protein [Streptomyces fructofermentans]|uniref:nuclear transport factor 2 family protein n=1 Tax=Streptomyces fructofermentans TaxID=152141 RepID=UPI003403F97F